MIIFKKGIGKLRNISYDELTKIINNLPDNWMIDYKRIYKSIEGPNEKYNQYNVKLYRRE